MTSIHDLIIILSLGMTMTFLCYCIEIGYLWWPSLKESFQHDKLTSSDRLARGIWIGFMSNLADNLYWGFAWFFVLLEMDLGTLMMLGGSFANVFFRQAGGIIAANDHVLAANEMHKGRRANYHKYYWYAGVFVFVAVLIIKEYII